MTRPLQIQSSSRGAASPGYMSSGSITGGGIQAGIDGVINLIESVSQEDFAIGRTFSGGAAVLNATHNFFDEWRVNVRKLAVLGRLQTGWDYPESQPLNRGAEANYLEWLSIVSADRMDDAEPMLTDDGNIRLEWRRDGYVRIAEIGSDSLYLAVLAPDRSNDDAEEFDRFDAEALDRFFVDGVIRS
jgi:hypothetical protein